MADTARWSLQQFADAAGKRTDPYPHEADAPPDNRQQCLGCGADLTGQRVKGSRLPRVYCGRECLRKANNRWHDRPDESAVLRLSQYSWSEW